MLSQRDMLNVRPIEDTENVYSIKECFRDVSFEEHVTSIIPFTKSNADIMMIAGLDDQLSDANRVVINLYPSVVN